MLAFTKNSFIAHLKMSKNLCSLVEGREDRDFVLNLREVLNSPRRNIYIASEMRTGFINPKNNRKKVEEIANSASDLGLNKISFLVDREYREFCIRRGIDKIGVHHSIGNVHWTLGHSCENYFFQPKLMASCFRRLSTAHWHRSASDMFCDLFITFLRIASIFSICDFRLNKSGLSIGLKSDIKAITSKSGNNITINYTNLEKILSQRIGDDAVQYIKEHKRLSGVLSHANKDHLLRIVRGHTGVVLFQSLYAWCLSSSTPVDLPQEVSDKVIRETLDASAEHIFKLLLAEYVDCFTSTATRKKYIDYPVSFLIS